MVFEGLIKSHVQRIKRCYFDRKSIEFKLLYS